MYYFHCWRFHWFWTIGREAQDPTTQWRRRCKHGAELLYRGKYAWGSKLPSKQPVHLWLCLLFAFSAVSVCIRLKHIFVWGHVKEVVETCMEVFVLSISAYELFVFDLYMHFFQSWAKTEYGLLYLARALTKCRVNWLFTSLVSFTCFTCVTARMLFGRFYLFCLAWYNTNTVIPCRFRGMRWKAEWSFASWAYMCTFPGNYCLPTSHLTLVWAVVVAFLVPDIILLTSWIWYLIVYYFFFLHSKSTMKACFKVLFGIGVYYEVFDI